MIEAGPKQAIIECLCSPLEGKEAREETLRFFQSRFLSNRQMHEITFEDMQGQPQRWICVVAQTAEGAWLMVGGANITGLKHWPWGDKPWVNLAGGNLGDFWLGGYVLQREQDIVRVRLISRNGNSLEDEVQDDLVLFLTEHEMPAPIRVELYDRRGNLINTHFWP